MKTTGKYYSLWLCVLSSLLLIAGCSEVSDDFRIPTVAKLKVHEKGFEDVEADNFHGNIIRENKWDWDGCQDCHGPAPAFPGGISGVSCATAGCHVDFQGRAKTVEDCNTCHGDFRAAADDFASFAPPRDLSRNTSTTAVGVGAHHVHLRGDIMSAGIRCGECHDISFVVDEDHLTPTGPDKIVFGDLASLETQQIDMSEDGTPPKYNPHATAPTCENTYCHGNFKSGNNFLPVWTKVDGTQADCGTCHGDPETGNPLPTGIDEDGELIHIPGQFNCQVCHWQESGQPIARRLQDGSYVIEQKDLHIDGNIYITGSKRTDW